LKEETKEKEALSSLLVDSTSYLTRLAVAAKSVLGIDKDSGKTVYLINASNLTDEERVFLVLLGRYLASKLGKSDSDLCTPSEISDESGLSEKTVSKRLSDLGRSRLSESPNRGKHRVVPANAEGKMLQIRKEAGVKA
jgi:hypothetical protein